MTPTLGFYIARRFLGITAGAFAVVFLLIVCIDLVELTRRSGTTPARFSDLLGMALLHAPAVSIRVAPYTVLLASMACFAMLARSSELVVTRAAGVSAWRILVPALVAAGLLGVAAFAIFNPVAAALSSRFEALEERLFSGGASRLSVTAEGIWLRQGGPEEGQIVIRAQRASGAVDRLWSVIVFQFAADGRLARRIDARAAQLEDRAWRLTGTRSWDLTALGTAAAVDAPASTAPELADALLIPTDLTPERILESFAAPETISFWKLGGFIRVLEQSGFNASRQRLHWHTLLAAPAIFLAMVLIGGAFSMRHVRFGGLGLMALGCVLTGFGYFFLADLAAALGASGVVPVLVAAWAPPASAVLFALGLLLHLEDG